MVIIEHSSAKIFKTFHEAYVLAFPTFGLFIKRVKVNPRSFFNNLGSTRAPDATYQISKPSVN